MKCSEIQLKNYSEKMNNKKVTKNIKSEPEKYISGKDGLSRNFGNFLGGFGLFEIRIPEYHFVIITEFGQYKRILDTRTHKYNPITEIVNKFKKIRVSDYERGSMLREGKFVELLEP